MWHCTWCSCEVMLGWCAYECGRPLAVWFAHLGQLRLSLVLAWSSCLWDGPIPGQSNGTDFGHTCTRLWRGGRFGGSVVPHPHAPISHGGGMCGIWRGLPMARWSCARSRMRHMSHWTAPPKGAPLLFKQRSPNPRRSLLLVPGYQLWSLRQMQFHWLD